MARLADLLRQKAADCNELPILVSDECHRQIVYPPNKFVSPAQYYDATVVVYSFGKSLLIQGQRIGYAAVSSRMPSRESLARALERLCRIMGFCSPTALMQLAIRKLLVHAADVQRLGARREWLASALRSYGYSIVPGQATFFLYVRSPEPDDFAFTEKLACRGVFVLPGSLFHDSGYFRTSVTASDKMLERALPVFASAIGG